MHTYIYKHTTYTYKHTEIKIGREREREREGEREREVELTLINHLTFLHYFHNKPCYVYTGDVIQDTSLLLKDQRSSGIINKEFCLKWEVINQELNRK
uniref:Bm799 n=1 Tax=Brugia malayi TaxID=6279 RepID=A0A1I9G5E5_BRUMA|nr:Bm799 [Brugia malayi]